MKKCILVLSLLITLLNANNIGIDEKLGETVPLDLTFINEESEKVTLKKLMDGKPTILTLNYFRCSGICTPQLNALAKVLGKLDLAENTDYKVITVSFAKDETPALAAAKRKNQIDSIGRAYVADAWHFVVDDNNSSDVLAKSVGFKYEKTISTTGKTDYIHAASLIVLSPEGKIVRYLPGVEQGPIDVKMALAEAHEGKVGGTIPKAMLLCFSYDPDAKKYVFMWEKVAGVVMLAMVLGFFLYLVKIGRKDEDHQNKES
ncbi:MAG TPA: SCO family protein [Sulfuricurvum sp.]|nr:SCO family protein [Sulfuricurvum sp.]